MVGIIIQLSNSDIYNLPRGAEVMNIAICMATLISRRARVAGPSCRDSSREEEEEEPMGQCIYRRDLLI